MDHRRLLSRYALLALFLIATSSPLYAEPPPSVRAVLDASVDAVWDATIESLRDASYKVREEHRVEGILSARRTRLVGRINEEEASKELKQIYRAEPHVGIDVRGMSEVTLTARISPSDGKTASTWPERSPPFSAGAEAQARRCP
jgi:hypothetical protein